MKLLETIEQCVRQQKLIYIWGTRAYGCPLGVWFDEKKIRFEGFTDNNKEKWGKAVQGEHTCIAPDELPADCFVLITAADKKIQQIISAQLSERKIAYAADIIDEICELTAEVDDKKILKAIFYGYFEKELNLDNPTTLNEKLNWLKIYDRKPIYTTMVDKKAVKDFVREKLGDKYVIPMYGVWDSFDEIDFERLPDRFVLKCTHDSGGIVVVTDKASFDREKAKNKLEESLKRNYYNFAREWPYKNVKPRIIAEKYIDTLGKSDSIEYKVTCFNGKVDFITICTGIAHVEYEKRTNDHYDINFNHMPWYSSYKNSTKEIKKPKQWEELIEISEKLAAGIPYLRVDFYIVDDQILFGEFTFYTWAGFIDFTPPEWDLILGNKVKLPEVNAGDPD